MDTRISKWGNSLAIRIPKALADQLNLTSGSPVEVVVRARHLEIIPVQPGYELSALLDGITSENRHDLELDDLARGGESW